MGLVIISIDLKSFYASAEAVDRGYAPLTTNLVVADASRTEKTICLAVSPSLNEINMKDILEIHGELVDYVDG